MKYFLSLVGLLFFVGAGCQPIMAPNITEGDIDGITSLLHVDEEWNSTIDVDALEMVVQESTGALSKEEVAGLAYMREEEKLARDVYMALYDMYGLRPFANIGASEQTHTDAVKRLLEVYDIEDPVTDTAVPGLFTNSELQALYTTLMAKGAESDIDALRVGAMIEEVDILDLQERALQTQKEDINTVYANLERGSENHLRAFVRQLTQRGEAYTPVYLSQEAYNAIISQENNSGR